MNKKLVRKCKNIQGEMDIEEGRKSMSPWDRKIDRPWDR